MRRLVLTILLAAALGGCAGLSGEPDIVLTVAPATAAPSTQPDAWGPDLVNGARIFAERCVDCHGESGDGQGELVLAGSIGQPLDMTDHAAVWQKSPLEFYQVITEGRLDKLMPPWQEALTEAERWDVALYSYSLSYDEALLAAGESIWAEACANCERPLLIAPVHSDAVYGAQLNAERFGGALTAEESGAVVAYLRLKSLESADGGEVVPLGNFGDIAGRVVHGSAGGVVPADTMARLQYGNSELGFSFAETSLDADLSFRFEGIPLREAFDYVLSAVYQGRLFSRQLPSAPASDVTIELFDVTNDPAVLKIARIDFFLDAIELADLGRGLQVSQIIGFENGSDRIFTSGRGFDDGREAVLLAQFPRGARVMSGDQGGRYIVIKDMQNIPDSVIDTVPVPPGDSHQVIMEYFLPFDGEARIEQSFIYPIDAEVNVRLLDQLSVEGDRLELERAEAPGVEWRAYVGRLQADDEPELRLEISEDPANIDGNFIVTVESLLPLLVGAGGILAVFSAGYGWTRRQRDNAENGAAEIDKLVAQLARLDEDHDQGRINHDLYHQRRRKLKARLAELMAAGE